MHMKKTIYLSAFIAVLSSICREAEAQVTVSAQLRTRTEFRSGQGGPLPSHASPAFFTSQRTRLAAAFSGDRLRIHTSLQDVRVWGQDASTVNRVTTDAHDGLMLHEAWAELTLIDTATFIGNLSLKIGRQELVYDDVRLLGNLDWLQQARRHDALLLKFEGTSWTVHAGAAYNQNSERKSGTMYNGMPIAYPAGTNGIGAMYKAMQFAHVSTTLPFGKVSFLFFKDDFNRFAFASTDTLRTTPVFNDRVWSRFTAGGNLYGTALKKITFALSAFYQGGRYREGTSLAEYLISGSFLYSATPRITVGPGVDITSGNDGSTGKQFQRFDPLYGTPHKFWGLMDYFYVADPFGASGLVDYYLKARYQVNDRLLISGDLHHFVAPDAFASENGVRMTKALGTELDLVAGYALTKVASIEAGFSAMLPTPTMASASVKNVTDPDDFSTWMYLMVSVRPEAFAGINKNK